MVTSTTEKSAYNLGPMDGPKSKLNRGQHPYMRYAPAFSVFLLLALTTTIAAHAQTVTTLYNFCSQGSTCSDGFYPYGGLVEGNDGNFYGTTSCGGTNPDPAGPTCEREQTDAFCAALASARRALF